MAADLAPGQGDQEAADRRDREGDADDGGHGDQPDDEAGVGGQLNPAGDQAGDTGPDYTPFDRQEQPDTGPAAIIVRLSYAGTGWRTFGDALLANAAADQARKRRDTGREELAEFIAWAETPKAA